MTPSLPELQRRFASALAERGAGDRGIAIYRGTIDANYRNALGATYRVVRTMLGETSFDAAVAMFVTIYPSTAGDLNSYGAEFAQFLAESEEIRDRPILVDIARLEWAIDCAQRASDAEGSPAATLAALSSIPAADIALQRLLLHPSCRLLRSEYPTMRAWRSHQSEATGDPPAVGHSGPDYLLVRRESGAVVVERVAPGDYAWLAALARGGDLAESLAAALDAEATFDLGTSLRAFIANATVCGIADA